MEVVHKADDVRKKKEMENDCMTPGLEEHIYAVRHPQT